MPRHGAFGKTSRLEGEDQRSSVGTRLQRLPRHGHASRGRRNLPRSIHGAGAPCASRPARRRKHRLSGRGAREDRDGSNRQQTPSQYHDNPTSIDQRHHAATAHHAAAILRTGRPPTEPRSVRCGTFRFSELASLAPAIARLSRGLSRHALEPEASEGRDGRRQLAGHPLSRQHARQAVSAIRLASRG